MHRALLVCELLTIIFHHLEELDLRTLTPSSKAGLAKCARTCKAWKGPALRIIWENLDSPLPLMKLFPLDAFSNGGRKGPEVWRYRRTLRPRDWIVFAEYAPLVRHLTFKEGKDVSTSAIIALDVQRPSKYRSSPLLPNLISLKWTVEISNTLTLCSTFVSPSLKRLNIHAVGLPTSAAERSDATGGLLCTITDIAPELTELELVVDRLWAVSDIVNPINALDRLQVLTLDVGSICPFILRGLPIHPSLRKLEINLCGIDEGVFEKLAAHRPRPGEFITLEELSITADMHIINSTLSLVIHTPLTRLSISTFSSVTAEQLRNCLLHISTTSPTLQKLTITTSFVGEFEPMFKILDQHSESYRVDLMHLLPVMNMKRLEDLSIQVGYPLLLDDVDVAMLVRALPVLRNLYLSPALEWAPSNWQPKLSMACLEWIGVNAPNIRSLGLAIDAHKASPSIQEALQDQMQVQISAEVLSKSPPTPPLTPDPSFVLQNNGAEPNATMAKMQPRIGRPSLLETLFLGSSLITESDEMKVRESLQRLFPSLVMIRTSAAAPQLCSDDAEASRRSEIWERIAYATASKKKRGGSEVYGRNSQQSKSVEMTTDQDIEMEIWDEEVDDCEYEWYLAAALGKEFSSDCEAL